MAEAIKEVIGLAAISALKGKLLAAVEDVVEMATQDDLPPDVSYRFSVELRYAVPDKITEPTEEEENVQPKTNKRNKNGRNKSADGELREGGEEESSQ